MTIEHCDFSMFHLLFSLLNSVPGSSALLSFFHFVNNEVVTVYKQVGLVGPCRAQGP